VVVVADYHILDHLGNVGTESIIIGKGPTKDFSSPLSPYEEKSQEKKNRLGLNKSDIQNKMFSRRTMITLIALLSW
jgi:ABC-type enterochelin transport system substrate-binding protein